MSEDDNTKGRCMIDGCCCLYDAIDCNTIELGVRSANDCICIRSSCCLSFSAKSLGVGLTTEEGPDSDEICKIALYCCDLGIIKPSTCCSGAESILCYYRVCSFPLNKDYIDECVCSFCFLQCAPTCGCCEAPPECPALAKTVTEAVPIVAATEMDRGEEVQAVEEKKAKEEEA